MKPTIQSEYRVSQESNGTRFSVTPYSRAKNPSRGSGGLLLVVGAVLFFIPITKLISLLVLAAGAFMYWGIGRIDMRPAQHRQSSSFLVSDEGVSANGNFVARDDIHQLILVNGLGGPVDMTLGTNAAMRAGQQIRNQAILNCYGLALEAGGKQHLLAGGMDDVTARGLLFDVSRRLGISVG